MAGITYDPDEDIPDLSGKVFVVTGGTGGLGEACILPLAKQHAAHIFFTGRDEKRAACVIEAATKAVPGSKVSFIPCDLGDLESVTRAGRRLVAESDRLDVLICNAGVMATPAALSKSGYEIQFGINHVGHALLIKLLLPTLQRTAARASSGARIVFLTSTGFRGHPEGGIVFKDLRTTQDDFPSHGQWLRYGQSKLANVLYPAELARRYPEITSVSVHPGVVDTALVSTLNVDDRALVHSLNPKGLQSPSEGVQNQLWAATAARGRMENGQFYEPVAVLGEHTALSQDAKLATELWDWTQRELEPYKL